MNGRRLLATGAAVCAASAAGCGDSVSIEHFVLESLSVEPDSAAVLVGDTARFRAFGRTTRGKRVPVQPVWFTTDPDVATIGAGGLLHARRPGHVRIQALAGGIEGTAGVAIGHRVARLELRPLPDTLRVGTAVRLEAMALGEDGYGCALDDTGRAFCWGVNHYGRLGTGGTAPAGDTLAPRPVAGGHVFTKISAAFAHACGLDAGSEIWCWGGFYR